MIIAKKPKPPNPILLKDATAIYENRTPGYVLASSKHDDIVQIASALAAAHFPLVTIDSRQVTPAILQQFEGAELEHGVENGDLLLGTQVQVKHVDYAVQVLVSNGAVTQAYAGKTDPTTIVLTPPTTPLNATRVTDDLIREFGDAGLAFGPIDPSVFGAHLYSLVEADLPTEAFNLQIDPQALVSGDGTQLSLRISLSANFGPMTWVEAVLNADGNVTYATLNPPQFLPVPDPEPYYTPGLSSVFIVPSS